jgi:hypothetical protein
MFKNSKAQVVESTPFSDFIRNASSAEKKRVYDRVLKAASERQNELVAETNKTVP